MGSTLIGGAAGSFLTHKVAGGGKFKTMLGGVAGAVVANVIENKMDKKNKHNHHGHHGHHGHQSQGGLGGMIGGFMGQGNKPKW